MHSVFVDHLSFALGDETYTVEQAAARRNIVSAPDILRQAGFAYHHICRPGTDFTDCRTGGQRVLCVPADRFPDGALYEQA